MDRYSILPLQADRYAYSEYMLVLGEIKEIGKDYIGVLGGCSEVAEKDGGAMEGC